MKTKHPVTDELEPEPLDPEQIVSGEPRTSSLTLASAEDGAESGLWRCTPGVVTDTEVKESFLVIAGKGQVEIEGGETIRLQPGATHHFEGGEKTVWTVDETVLKAYWIAA